jgi:hypothetical protein
MPQCIYCNNKKEPRDFSKEHIIPKGIGGNLSGQNPFVTNQVCKRCNNICGAYVDGPFVKNFFTNNNRAFTALNYCNVEAGEVVPLTFIGTIESLNFESKICEFWLGPTGDSIFHFHEPYPYKGMPPMVGQPTNLKSEEIDTGFAFIFVASNNPIWHKTIIFSFVNQFHSSILYLGNGPKPQGEAFSEIPTSLNDLRDKLNEQIKIGVNAQISLQIDFDLRFLCKIALGIGFKILGDRFNQLEFTKTLRDGLWSKTAEDRNKLPIRGKGSFTHDNSELKKVFGLKGGHLLCLFKVSDSVALISSFYGEQCSVIQISDQPEEWKEAIPGYGSIAIISPSKSKGLDFFPLEHFLAALSSSSNNFQRIHEMFKLLNDQKVLPPFKI